ncbi:MAG: putative toxin-antitoxin system toxin component, PIN family [Fibrobacter sp.]|nr:putative toxin-antitoxin system toxin component, PIN family [Fibrobacter sp.]
MKKIYAVIDTNVIISALITKNANSATLKVLDAFYKGCFQAVAHEDIIAEYNDVLSRGKFSIPDSLRTQIINTFKQNAIFLQGVSSDDVVSDPKDVIFYEVTLEAQSRFKNSYLVTGNAKDFPVRTFVISPADFLDLIQNDTPLVLNEALASYCA